MLKLEAILEEKAKKANQGLIIQGLCLAKLGFELTHFEKKCFYILPSKSVIFVIYCEAYGTESIFILLITDPVCLNRTKTRHYCIYRKKIKAKTSSGSQKEGY